MEEVSIFLAGIRDIVWGVPMIILLLGTHLFLTYKTRFIQRKIPLGIKLSITKDDNSKGDVSQFQALTTALASTIGTGNIIGVGTALYLGGPGAVFWCWITGVFGIATKYAESLIGVKYRVQSKDGRMLGGAMYALERGLNLKWLAIAFAFFASAPRRPASLLFWQMSLYFDKSKSICADIKEKAIIAMPSRFGTVPFSA